MAVEPERDREDADLPAVGWVQALREELLDAHDRRGEPECSRSRRASGRRAG